VKFYASTVLGAISNTDYSGEIADKGDKVIIRQTPTITIRDYSKNSTLIHERPEEETVELLIDKAKYFDFICDDIVKYQSDIDLMNDWSDDASMQMKITIDELVINDVYSEAHASNAGALAGAVSGSVNMGAAGGGSAVSITKANIIDTLVDCDTVLDEQNVPETDRWIVIPPWMRGVIMKSDLKDASMTGDGTSILRNGRIGRIGNFTLYVSNLYDAIDDTETTYRVIGGQKKALSFAAQMTEMDSIKAESTFGTIVRGLNVFGYKVLKTEALFHLYCTKP